MFYDGPEEEKMDDSELLCIASIAVILTDDAQGNLEGFTNCKTFSCITTA